MYVAVFEALEGHKDIKVKDANPGLASQAAPQGRPRASVVGSKAGFEQFYIFASSSIFLLFRLRHLNCNIKNKTKNAI